VLQLNPFLKRTGRACIFGQCYINQQVHIASETPRVEIMWIPTPFALQKAEHSSVGQDVHPMDFYLRQSNTSSSLPNLGKCLISKECLNSKPFLLSHKAYFCGSFHQNSMIESHRYKSGEQRPVLCDTRKSEWGRSRPASLLVGQQLAAQSPGIETRKLISKTQPVSSVEQGGQLQAFHSFSDLWAQVPVSALPG
jgi:hypothetical protein